MDRLRAAIDEIGRAAGYDGGVRLEVFEGPSEYLYGEETALLEAIEGRPPLPRVAPPYRRGVDELGRTGCQRPARRRGHGRVPTARPTRAPALVDNVETLANVPAIVAKGAGWFREMGTDDIARHHRLHGGRLDQPAPASARSPWGRPCGRSSTRSAAGPEPVAPSPRSRRACPPRSCPPSALDTPLTYEAMAAAGSGLGSCGFTVFDDQDDLVAAVAGTSRFLAVESCGQCTPCKQDGRAIADLLAALARSELTDDELGSLQDRVRTVADEARCFLASQQEAVVRSLLETFPEAVVAHFDGRAEPAEPRLVAELVERARGSRP